MTTSERALWRYSIIAPLLHRAAGVTAESLARHISQEPLRTPEGEPTGVSHSTVLRWYRTYQENGLPGLEDLPRKDRGDSRVLDEKAQDLLLTLAEAHVDWTTKAIHKDAQKTLGRPLSIKAVYRFLQGRKRDAVPPEHRRRPAGTPMVLWLADTMHGPRVLNGRRKPQKTYLIAILDDASRAIMGSRFALHDNIAMLIPILRDALLARGLCHRLLVDNGPNYRSRVLRTACATLGIHLIHASPYRPTSKARLERFFKTVRMQFLPTLPSSISLDGLNTEWNRFLPQYHQTPHRTLSAIEDKPTCPGTFYLKYLPDDVRYVSDLMLEDLMMLEETRMVYNDGTIRVGGKAWEVDAHLVRSRVVVRFTPGELTRVLYRPSTEPDTAFRKAFPVA